MSNLKTYTIDDILNDGSSSEEEEEEEKYGMNHFPWLKKGYETIYDDLAYDPNTKKNIIYPKASETDNKYSFGLGLD